MTVVRTERATRVEDVLLARAADEGTRTAVTFLDDDLVMTYAELDRRARAVAVALAAVAAPGARALLMCGPGAGYVTGFYGCLHAGVVAVPVPPPTGRHGSERVLGIMADSGAEVLLLDRTTARGLPPELAAPRVVTIDDVPDDLADDWSPHAHRGEETAFLQYTSGSTGAPKGVVVGHDNLLHNCAVLGRVLGPGDGVSSVSWLPPYHDMGLIGGILAPVHAGFPVALMSPTSFLRRPVRWLRAISEHRATASVAPDFGYAECLRRVTDEDLAGLDLRTWRSALVGAETVRAATLDAFAARFGAAGFRRSSFQPCYGLAEATLFVTGGVPGRGVVTTVAPGSGVPVVGCGHVRAPDAVLVVDPETRLTCQDRTEGEIWVSGPTVTRGYWRAERATAEVFGAERADGPGTFLRTGDLGFLDGGELFVTGRRRELIVLRGHNYHPADIEVVAGRADPVLLPGRGAAFQVGDGRLVLVHEVSSAGEGAARAAAAVRAAVVTEHGVDLDDVVLVRRGALPRTSSGKLRRLATRERYLGDGFRPLAVTWAAEPVDPAPDGPLAATVARVLGRPVDATRPLVAQGLDSVRAVELVSVLYDEFGVDVSPAWLLDGATVTTLDGLPRGTRPAGAAGVEAAHGPASAGQTRLWLLDEIGAGAALHVGGGVRLRGRLAVAALRTAVGELFRRHTALRTTLDIDADGVVWQTVRPWAEIDLPELDVRATELEAAYRRELGAPFDLRSAMVRVALARFADDDAALLVCAHHAAVDGWSMGVLGRELAELYRAVTEGRPPVLPRVATVGAAGDGGAEFWRRELADAPVLELPVDRPRTNRTGSPAGYVPVRVEADVAARLRVLAEEEHTTLNTVLVAGFAALLARWSGQREVVFGSFVANRHRPGAERLVGSLALVLPLRVDTGVGSFRALVDRARATGLAALAHQDTPLEAVIQALGREHGGSPGASVRAVFGLRPPVPDWTTPDLTAEPFEIPPAAAQFELAVELVELTGGGLAGRASFAADLFDEPTVAAMVTDLGHLLTEAAANPDRALARLSTADEHVARWSDPAPLTDDPVPAHRLVESRVDGQPDAVAVEAPDGLLTYLELDQRANRLAAHLRGLGIGVGDLVGVYLPHSAAGVVAFLATLKAGAAYLPLDAGYPAAQLRLAAGEARPAAVVSRSDVLAAGPDVAAALTESGARLVRLDTDAIAHQPAHRVPVSLRLGDLAYVIYTSGSTGRPKGTANTHLGLANHTRWHAATFPLSPGDGVLHRTPLGFDMSVTEVLWPLVAGARLVVPPEEDRRDPARWAEFCRRRGVNNTYVVPSVLKLLVAERGPFTRLLSVGEPLTPELVASARQAMPGVAVHNVYGPAEAAMVVTHEPVPDEAGPVSIGRPIDGTRCYVLDAHAAPVPVGVTGELYLAGACLARGYLSQPGLTATRFVADPFRVGERMYRTGDRARWWPDGRLEFLGRVDGQVKIRGHRVEPGAVEAALAGHGSVRDAVVVAADGPGGDRMLVAYVVGADVEEEELRTYLRRRVQDFMVPQAIVVVDGIPLNASGKVDRRALPVPGFAGRPGYRPPRAGVERALADIWTSVLRVPRVGRDDEFHRLGGHSLMATQLAARLRSGFGLEITVVELLERRWTLADQADEVQRRQLEQADREEVLAMLRRIEALTDREAAGLLTEGRPDDAAP
ncbi:non-ribosomal peptide synthetase [Actinophytocola oryzae]|uniref:Amino acid adenylation domain-containing protein n=1 Tax=Actinophytocola oryzae TaxID=502181 RepID=A0A4R7V6P0_9PSEU|nr:non-ribosomal peptide synthetase [Actinophytocola oryzae]TDV43216.1 amino acid adenylation domain-containing protein [Actinophytocola oryzae]